MRPYKKICVYLRESAVPNLFSFLRAILGPSILSAANRRPPFEIAPRLCYNCGYCEGDFCESIVVIDVGIKRREVDDG